MGISEFSSVGSELGELLGKGLRQCPKRRVGMGFEPNGVREFSDPNEVKFKCPNLTSAGLDAADGPLVEVVEQDERIQRGDMGGYASSRNWIIFMSNIRHDALGVRNLDNQCGLGHALILMDTSPGRRD